MTTTLYNIIKAHEEDQRIQFNRIFSKREYFYRFSIIFYCYLKMLFYICGINETSYRDKRRTGSHYLEKSNKQISLNELSERVGITPANLSVLKTGKAKAIRFSTLEAICKELNCQPGDIMEWREDE